MDKRIEVTRDGETVEGVEVDFTYTDGRWTLAVASREGMQELIFRDRERYVAQAVREAVEAGKPARLTRTEAGGPEITLGYRMGLTFEPLAPATIPAVVVFGGQEVRDAA